jgi:hypothetical protein
METGKRSPQESAQEPPAVRHERFQTVFGAELKRVRTSRKNRAAPDTEVPIDGEHPDAAADAMGLIGLSFSGGGIRSATFNLGMLQALAKTGILRHVDYLSTVSGGGYIGAWLNAMIHRADSEATGPAHGMDLAEPGLIPGNLAPPNRQPQDAIAYLRAYSNYLTPKVSLLSADTWSLAAIWFRNTILNLTILVSGIAALMLAARCFGIWTLVRSPGSIWYSRDFWICVWMCGLSLTVSAVFLGMNVGRRLRKTWRSDRGVQILVVAPAIVVALSVTVLICNHRIPDATSWIFYAGGFLAAAFFLFQSFAGFWYCFQAQHDNKHAWLWGGLVQVGVAALSSLVTACLFHFLVVVMYVWQDAPYFAWLLLAVCPPIVLTVLTLGVVVNIGLLGRDIPDDVREWTGRLGAWIWIYAIGWLLFFGAAIYGPLALQQSWGWARYAVSGGYSR